MAERLAGPLSRVRRWRESAVQDKYQQVVRDREIGTYNSERVQKPADGVTRESEGRTGGSLRRLYQNQPRGYSARCLYAQCAPEGRTGRGRPGRDIEAYGVERAGHALHLGRRPTGRSRSDQVFIPKATNARPLGISTVRDGSTTAATWAPTDLRADLPTGNDLHPCGHASRPW